MTVGDLAAEVWSAARQPLPLPGSGLTVDRFEALAALGAQDLCLAKLVEPHHDATAILTELGADPPGPDSLWGVWAAEPPFARVSAGQTNGEWRLSGCKAFCSGALVVTHALMTAEAADGPRLFAVDLAAARANGRIQVAPENWVGAGMRRAQTRTLELDDVPAIAVGGSAAYVDRPGFWHGGVGVAACWLGGARAVGTILERAAVRRDIDPHAAAHLGALTAVLDAASAHLHAVAGRIDADPRDVDGRARRDAQSLRTTAVAAAEAAIDRTGRALGPAPLAFDADHAQRVSDLQTFIRQHHAERDLADLGRLVAARARSDETEPPAVAGAHPSAPDSREGQST